jgi:hypothetical protein
VSTRSVIARVDGDSWVGRYVHWGGRPQERGWQLWRLYCGRFGGDLRAMLLELIDAHPAGWVHLGQGATLADAECFCHDRGEGTAREYWERAEDAETDCVWAYAFNERTRKLFVYFRAWDGVRGVWRLAAVVDLCGVEPDWAQIEERRV